MLNLATPPPCETFVDLLRWRALTHPELMAMGFFGDGENLSAELSYGELDRQARTWALKLLALHPPGTRALLVFPPGLDFMLAFAGCLYAGWIPVPAYPPESHRLEHSLKRLLAIIADAQAPVVLTIDAFRQMAENMLQQSGQANLQALDWLTPTDLTGLDPAQWQCPPLNAESLAFLQYTSGSTGTPKGVMISHGNLMANMAMIKNAFEHGERQDTVVCWVPFYHDMGLVGHLLQSLYIGGKNLIISPLDFLRKPLRWLKLISDWRGTSTGAPNFAFDLCVRKISPAERDALDLSSLRLVLNGAEPVQHATVERFLNYFAPAGFPRHAIYPAYGMAEATVFISGSLRAERPVYLGVDPSALAEHRVRVLPEADPTAQVWVGSGKPNGDEAIRVVDPHSCQDLGEDRVGEIWLRGSHIAQGYWRREAETQASFGARLNDGSPEKWLRSGDLGFLHQGEIFVTGRIKDLIIIRGRNLYPQDLERQVESLRADFPAIRPGCSVAVALTGAGSEQLALLLEVAVPFDAGEALCQALVTEIEAAFEIAPRQILLLPPGALPKTSSGKLMRQACRQALEKNPQSFKPFYHWPQQLRPTEPAQRALTSSDPSSDKNPLLLWLQTWLATELQGSPTQFSLTQPLRAQGLDSALAVRLHADLESLLQRPLSPSLLWDYPSLEKLLPALTAPAETPKAPPASAPQRVPQPTQAPVAIVGVACRFPGPEGQPADQPERFWEQLLSGQEAIREAPPERFGSASGTLKGGYLANIQDFDADFFGISAREAENMDPQQRLLLELAWEALENAQIAPASLKEQNVGIFIGLSGSDYAQRSLFGSAENRSGSSVTGVALSVAAGRIAYQLGTQGPALTVDTACSSGLVAVHLACQSLNSGECDLALAGAVNLILEREISQGFQLAGALAADGHCKSFSEAADGYVRSEGGGMVVLKRATDQIPGQEPLWGHIRASAVNHDGMSQGLTAPNGLAQQRLLRQALDRAGLQPEDLGYLEAHGTGTPLGDPIEVAALHAVFGERPSDRPPLYIGAVKSHLGHLEAAAGLAGLIKTLLVLRHGVIPANLNGLPLNPRLSAFVGPLAFPSAPQVWPEPRWAGVSSFGISGTNAHLILEAPPPPAAWPVQSETAQLLVLSARSQVTLREEQRRLQVALQSASAPPNLSALAAALARLRSSGPWRLSWVAQNLAEFQARLAEEPPEEPAEWPAEKGPVSQAPGLVWVFPGQGGQWSGMGHELLQEPAFAAAFQACAEAFAPWFPEGLTALLQHWQEDRIDQIQPLLCAYQIALARLWQSWGIFPQAVIGHSMGEVAAAHIAGYLSLPDAARIICERSRLMQGLPPGGGMLLTDLSWEAAARWEKPYLVRAVQAGPQQTVLAGEVFALSQVAITLEVTGRLARPIAVSVASHSPFVDPLLPEITQSLQGIRPQAGNIAMLSTVTGEWIDPANPALSAPYWAQNLRAPVLFQHAITQTQAQGYRHFLEIGPHPVLAPGLQSQGIWATGSGRRGQAERASLLASLAELYQQGCNPDWQGLFPKTFTPWPLPPKVWERQPYWLPGREQPAHPAPETDSAKTQNHGTWQPLPASDPGQPSPQTVILAGGKPAWQAALSLILESAGLTCLTLPEALLKNSDNSAWERFGSTLSAKAPALLWLDDVSPPETDPPETHSARPAPSLPALNGWSIWSVSQNRWPVLPTALAKEQGIEQEKEQPSTLSSEGIPGGLYLCDLPDTRASSWGKLAQLLRQPPTLETPSPLALRQGQWYYWQAQRVIQRAAEKATQSAANASPEQEKLGIANRETASAHFPPRADASPQADLTSQLKREIAQLLRLTSSQVEADTPLDSYGFDSLLAVELRQRLERLTGLEAPTSLLQRGVSINQILAWVESQRHSESDPQA